MAWPKDRWSGYGIYSPAGPVGPTGPAGADGEDATIAIGTVTDVPHGTPPTVTNSGTPSAAILDFELEAGADGANGSNGADGDNAYVYIAYASADDGTDFTLTFDADLDYIAILSTDTEIVSPVVGDFAGLWKNYKGATGATGPGDIATDTIWDAAGDLVVGTGANTAAKLTKGAEGKVLTAGASTVSWETPAGGGHVIQDETTPMTARANLNFTGAGVTVTDNAGTGATDVTIPGDGGSGGGSFLVMQVFS